MGYAFIPCRAPRKDPSEIFAESSTIAHGDWADVGRADFARR